MISGEEFRDLRKSKGLTLKDVAKALHTTEQTINKYELEVVRNIPLDKIEKLANLYGVSPAYIMGWEDEETVTPSYFYDPEAAEIAQALFDRPELKVLFDASRDASKEDIEQVAAILEKMAGK